MEAFRCPETRRGGATDEVGGTESLDMVALRGAFVLRGEAAADAGPASTGVFFTLCKRGGAATDGRFSLGLAIAAPALCRDPRGEPETLGGPGELE